MSKEIRAEFKLILNDFEEDFPNQKDEYRVQRLIESMTEFVRRTVDDCTETEEEENAVEFAIAMKLLSYFHGRIDGDLLKKRLMSRCER